MIHSCNTRLHWVVRPLAVHVELVLVLPFRQINDGHKGVLTLDTDDKRGKRSAHTSRVNTARLLSLIDNYDMNEQLINPGRENDREVEGTFGGVSIHTVFIHQIKRCHHGKTIFIFALEWY